MNLITGPVARVETGLSIGGMLLVEIERDGETLYRKSHNPTDSLNIELVRLQMAKWPWPRWSVMRKHIKATGLSGPDYGCFPAQSILESTLYGVPFIPGVDHDVILTDKDHKTERYTLRLDDFKTASLVFPARKVRFIQLRAK